MGIKDEKNRILVHAGYRWLKSDRLLAAHSKISRRIPGKDLIPGEVVPNDRFVP